MRDVLEGVWKFESAKIIAAVTRVVNDVGVAEELAQDALVAALEQWPREGVPDNPGAWLMTIAKRRAVDFVRRSQNLERKQEQIVRDMEREPEDGDDLLRLMFMSCHPVLPMEARVALTLRLLGGLTNAEIARAFLTNEAVIARRISEAKRTLAEEGVAFERPEGAERLSSVLGVIYLVFNEGYSATSGDDLLRPGLTLEALRLGRLLAELAPGEAEVHGLVALMEIQESRSAARVGPGGEPVQLHEQDRGRWDPLLIRRGFQAMLRARELGAPPGPYVLQAAIAVSHAQARTAEETDWGQIAGLYELLVRLVPTAVVRLNRAVAVGFARGAEAGLKLVEELVADPSLRDYHLLPGVRGDLLLRLGRGEEARREFARAASLTRNAAERAFLLRRAAEIEAPEATGPTFGEMVEEFLAGGFGASTVRSYRQTFDRLRRAVGDQAPMDDLTPEVVARTFRSAWGEAAATTWNRHRSAVRSFGEWAGIGDLSADVERRDETPAQREEPDSSQVWNVDAPLRERVLWRLLHESAAPVTTVLALNVEDLDLDDRRARVGGRWVTWRAETARLLPGLIDGRARGPLFLSDRRPAPARMPGAADLCPETGRRRLSYERAEYLFKRHTGHTLRSLKPGPTGEKGHVKV